MSYIFTRHQLGAVHNYLRDSSLSTNIIRRHPTLDSIATQRYRAFMQTYNHAMISNSCSLKKTAVK
jgi:hypothetical protein